MCIYVHIYIYIYVYLYATNYIWWVHVATQVVIVITVLMMIIDHCYHSCYSMHRRHTSWHHNRFPGNSLVLWPLRHPLNAESGIGLEPGHPPHRSPSGAEPCGTRLGFPTRKTMNKTSQERRVVLRYVQILLKSFPLPLARTAGFVTTYSKIMDICWRTVVASKWCHTGC